MYLEKAQENAPIQKGDRENGEFEKLERIGSKIYWCRYYKMLEATVKVVVNITKAVEILSIFELGQIQ